MNLARLHVDSVLGGCAGGCSAGGMECPIFMAKGASWYLGQTGGLLSHRPLREGRGIAEAHTS